MSVLIHASGIDAGYHGRAVVRDINLSVESGEIVGILGVNGAGKSTTLKALVGEIGVLKGEVYWKGRPSRKPLHVKTKEGLGYIPEDRSVFPELTVEENLRLGRGGVSRALGHFPELQAHLQRRAGLLSGGQQQMVTLARVLAAEPELLVIDELSQGLAPILVQRLFGALVQAAEDGVGVLLVEQYAHLAMDIAKRVVVLKRGRIIQQGEVADLQADAEGMKELYFGAAHS